MGNLLDFIQVSTLSSSFNTSKKVRSIFHGLLRAVVTSSSESLLP